MKCLEEYEIESWLEKLPGWQRDGDAVKKEWLFEDFKSALTFINRVGELAEQFDHHPELYNVYNRVSLRYTTHDANGLTRKDMDSACAIEKFMA